ncbi:Ig-like domain-containing protein, partial [Arcicella aurantiaca]
TYYVACVSGAGCKSTSGSVTVTVNPTPNAPTAISASPATICSGQSSTLSANCATGTVTWYSNSGLTNIITSPSPATPSTTTTYYVACVSSAGCKSSGGNVTITVNQTPTAPTAISASPATICSGQSSTLSATCATGTTTWYSDAVLTNVVSSPVNPTSTTTYYVSCVSGAGCKSISGNVTVTVNPTPTTPTAISASPATICSGQSSTLSATCATGTATWYSNSGLTTTVTSPVSPTSTTTYYVACVSNAGCKSTSGNITVTVNPTPSAPINAMASPATICSGQSSTLSATCTTGTVTWYSDAALTNVLSSTTVSPTANTSYYVSCVSGAGCKSSSVNVGVAVNQTPSAPTAVSASPTTICSGQISTLSATCATGTAIWYTNAGLTTTVTSPVSPTSTTSYYVACVSSTGCKSSAMNVGITVNPTPPLPTVNSVQYCQGDTPAQLVVTASSGATVLWYNVATGGTSSTTAPTPSTVTAGTTNYYVSQILNSCETERVTLAVVVNQNPALSLTAGNITCAGSGKGTIIANTTGGTPSYTYSKDNGVTFQSGNVFSGINAGTYNIIAKDSKGCINTQSIVVTQSDPIVLLSETTNDCTLGNNGIIKVSGSGGTAPLTYNLNGGTYGASTVFSNLSSGVYTIGVKDANGCTLTNSVSVNSVPDLTITLDSQNDCIVGNTGSITVVGNGGTSPYNFRINGGTWGGNTFNSLSAGTYTIDVLDARNCMKSLTVTITENPSAPTTTSPTICLGESTTLSGTCSSGVINWYADASLTTPLSTTTVTPSVTTTYYATCEIASVECISSSSTSIVTVNPIPTVNVVSNQVLCKGTSSTAIAFSGADTGTIFSWTNNNANIGLATSGSGDILPFTSTNSGVVPINGTIMVTPTFTNNEVTCTGLPTNFTITVNPIPTVNTVTNIAACNTSTVPTVSFSGTVASTVYSWTNSNTNIGLGASGTGDITAFSATNSTTSPITGNVTVTPSFTSSSVTCTGSPKTFAIAVNPTPTVNAVANQTLCNGSSTTAISFTGAVAGTVYSWTNTNPNIGLAESGIGNMASFSATNSGVLPISGTITITPSYTNNGITCTGTPQNFTITVNPTPTVNPISNQTLCDGSATNAIGFTGAVSRTTYSWTNTNSNIGLAVSGSGDIPTFNVTNSTNSTILGTISVIPSFTNNGVTCTGTSQNFTITVNPIPTVNTVSNQTLCNGSATTAINFTGAVTGTIYSWTNTNANIGLASSGAGNITTFTATNATNAPISGTITVTPTFTNNGVTCTGTSKNVAITVNPTPSVNSISNQTLCNGSATTAVNFTGAVTGTTYAWTNTNASIGLATSGSGDIPTFTATNATNASIAGTITVTPSFTNNGVTCTGASQNFTITVNPIPTVNTVTNKTLCHGTSTTAINFTGNVSNTVYSWTNTNTSIGLGDNGTGNISAFTAINSGTTVSTGTITVTPTFTNNGVSCVGTSKNFTISVNPIPSVNAISDQLVCNNSATTAVSFSGAVAGTSYDWTNTNTNIGLAASGSGNIPSFTAQNSTNSPISGTITVIPNFTNNGVTCTNTSQSFNIAVNPTPTVNNIANQSLCNGATTSAISFTGSVAGTVYSWTNSNIGIGLSSSGTGDIPAFSVTNTGSTSILGTITVTPSYSNNGLTCVGLAKTFTISANPIPKATITPDVINICSGDNVSLSITDEKAVSGSTSYSWSRDNTSNLTGLAVGGSVTSISGIVTNVTSSTQISVIIANVTSQFGCNSMGIAKIAVTPPLIVTISGNTFFCGTGQINKFTTLTASPVGGTGSYSYQWNLNGTAISGATSSTYDASNAGDYTVTVVSEFCTKTSNTITVNDPYNLSAQPTVTPSSSAICGSGTVRLTASSTSNLGTFNWYNTPTSLSQLSPTSGTRNEVYNTPTLNSSQTYYVARIYSVVGSIPLISCETDRTSVNITVNSTPTTPVATGSVVICKGGNTDLILSSGCTGTITWKNATTNAVVGTGSPLNVSPTVTTGYNATCSENGCLSNNSNTVTVTVSNITLSATPTNLTCKANNSGQITLTASGGTSAYSYSIDGTNFQSSNTFSGLSAGAYTLTVKDANACSATTTVTLTEPAILGLTETHTNLTCKANASGQITLTASGGTTAYSYSIDGTNFQSSNTFTSLSAGAYTLTVKDANACLATTTVTLTEPNTLTLSANQVNLTCKTNASGQIALTASGGTTAYSYSTDGTNFQSGNTFTGLSAGAYTLTVKDANACLATTTVTLTEPNSLTLSATPTNLTCKANNSGQIALTATGGTTAYS